MPLTSSLSVGVSATQTLALDLATATFPVTKSYPISLASGVGANQADRLFSDTRTLAASATENLDLAGVLTDAFGATLTFVKVKAVIISAAAANTNTVDVTRPASNGTPLFLAASDGLSVRPGGLFLLAAPDLTGYAVTAATGDLITVTNGGAGTSVTYDVVILGTSA